MFLAIYLLVMLVAVVPIKWASDYFEAERGGYGWSFSAISLSLLLIRIAKEFTDYGNELSVFLAAAAFWLVLGISYMRGLTIAVFQSLAFVVLGLLFQVPL